jgi:hypothetical protein
MGGVQPGRGGSGEHGLPLLSFGCSYVQLGQDGEHDEQTGLSIIVPTRFHSVIELFVATAWQGKTADIWHPTRVQYGSAACGVAITDQEVGGGFTMQMFPSKTCRGPNFED